MPLGSKSCCGPCSGCVAAHKRVPILREIATLPRPKFSCRRGDAQTNRRPMPLCGTQFNEGNVPPWTRGDFRGVLETETTPALRDRCRCGEGFSSQPFTPSKGFRKSFSCRLAAPSSMRMWEPLSERRFVVSTEDLRSPRGTAAPTFRPHFQKRGLQGWLRSLTPQIPIAPSLGSRGSATSAPTTSRLCSNGCRAYNADACSEELNAHS